MGGGGGGGGGGVIGDLTCNECRMMHSFLIRKLNYV